MPDKKAQWGRKAQDEERPDPQEFIFGKREAEKNETAAPASGTENNEGQKDDQSGGQKVDPRPPEPEPMVRITVDVRKSIHKELQRVCNSRELKIAQLIRQLIDRELKKSKNRQ